MRRSRWLHSSLFVVLTALLLAGAALADERGEGELINKPPAGGLTPEQIIQKFAAREKEFETARDDYTYRQSVKVDTLDGDTPDGEYQEVVDVLFDDQGKRVENVVYAPQNTLQRIQMTQEDYQDIRNLMPFVLTTEELPEYNITYLGQQKEDELNTYVFDVNPKQIDRKKRRFQGRIWVDDHDFQIVKTYGKAVPDRYKSGNGENVFPKFTTYREQIDGQYWFPTYTIADDELHFSNQDVHIKEVVRYTNYKRFRSTHKIIFAGQEVPNQQQKPQPQSPQQ
jgi:hypothetical protein